MLKHLQNQEPQIYQAIKNELKRQQDGLELIPSENFVSETLLEALGSILTNKSSSIVSLSPNHLVNRPDKFCRSKIM